MALKQLFCIIFTITLFSQNLFTQPIRSRDLLISGTSFAGGLLVGLVGHSLWAKKHYPEALECKKIKVQQKELKRKEKLEDEKRHQEYQLKLRQEQALKEAEQKKEWLIAQQHHGDQRINNTRHLYSTEIHLLGENKITDPSTLRTIIEQKYKYQDAPLTHYCTTLVGHINALQQEKYITSDKETERQFLIVNLEKVLQAYNSTLAHEQKAEQKIVDEEQRKRLHHQQDDEMKKLSLQKLHLEVQQLHTAKTAMDQLNNLKSALENNHETQKKWNNKLVDLGNDIKRTQVNHHDETKQLLKKQEISLDTLLHYIKSVSESTQKILTNIIAQIQNVGAITHCYSRPPAINPEVSNVMPSAPPLGL